ncbi:MAG: hypothetical protein DWH91_13900 [Planctomycetota bacterium]|nr:MAG: hypothetical protein DWH91_13900 [Planctomycetota bacterium]
MSTERVPRPLTVETLRNGDVSFISHAPREPEEGREPRSIVSDPPLPPEDSEWAGPRETVELTVPSNPSRWKTNHSPPGDPRPQTMSPRQKWGAASISLFAHLVLIAIGSMIVLRSPKSVVDIFTEIRTGESDNSAIIADPLPDQPVELNMGQTNSLAAPIPLERAAADQPSLIELDINTDPVEQIIDAEAFLGSIAKSDHLAGRTEEARAMMVAAQGGSASTEAAVNQGLVWLAQHQQGDGHWNFRHDGPGCDCPHHGSLSEASTGATAMALLCYLGAGHTHLRGKYQPQVARGLKALTNDFDKASVPGDLRQTSAGNSGMYTQGIATIVLCEVYALSGDRDIGRRAQKAVDFIVAAQYPQNGAWRYEPLDRLGDTSVVGWQVMALTSARMAKLSVPAKVGRATDRFLTLVQLENGAYYGYTAPEKRPTTTAIGLLCRMYQGWQPIRPAMKKGVAYLAEIGPNRDNMYYNYYATQVLHHWGGEEWKTWNRVLREQLVTTQSTTGHAKGSWAPRDPHAGVGGRHYMTCLAILTLEVYYRHLPLYQRKSIEPAT